MLTIKTQLSHASYAHNADQDTHLVITLTAPAKEGEATRPTLCIVPTIDVSGSMTGAPLAAAKQSALTLLDHLKDGDYCGVVAFDTHVHVIAAPEKLTPESRVRIRQGITGLRSNSSTNFAGGMLKALDLIDKLDLPAAVIKRVIMLTDGEANAGPATKPEDILKLLVNAGTSTVSAFGYGNNVNQTLLTELAEKGKGSYATIDHPDKALTAFGRELGGLVSTYASDLVIEIEPTEGHYVDRVVSDVESEKETVGRGVTIRLPSLLAEETRHVVVALKLGAQKQAFPRAVNLLTATLRYNTLAADGRQVQETAETKAKVQFVKPGDETKQPDQELAQIIALAQLVEAQKNAEEKAKQGDFQGAVAALNLNTAESALAGNVTRTAGNLRRRYANQEAYQASAGYRTSLNRGMTRGLGTVSYGAEVSDDLDGLGVVLSNSSMESTGTSFESTLQPSTPSRNMGFSAAPPTSTPFVTGLQATPVSSPNIMVGARVVPAGLVQADQATVEPYAQPLSAEELLAQLPAQSVPHDPAEEARKADEMLMQWRMSSGLYSLK